MTVIQKQYIVDEEDRKVAVQIDIEDIYRFFP